LKTFSADAPMPAMGGDFFSDGCFFMAKPAHQVVTSLDSAVLTCKQRQRTHV
jgi:hypothetical protein